MPGSALVVMVSNLPRVKVDQPHQPLPHPVQEAVLLCWAYSDLERIEQRTKILSGISGKYSIDEMTTLSKSKHSSVLKKAQLIPN